MLLATGSDDRTVRPADSRTLAQRLQAVGVPAELIEYRGVGHVTIVAALAAPLRFLAPTLDDADRFLRRAAARGPRSSAASRAEPIWRSGGARGGDRHEAVRL